MTDASFPAFQRQGPAQIAGSYGLPMGTNVLTLDGILPVEHLYPGDRVITRRGVRTLKALTRCEFAEGTSFVQLTKNALGGRPDQDLWVLPDQPILIRDWRAKAIWGKDQACVPAKRLVDGAYVTWVKAPEATAILAMSFGSPEILYANGVEIASADSVMPVA